ncbi:MAG: hypothetical protein IJU36_03920 [Paludibacteraceae bacterium]|nr:hypothetical protein [Paludibacteraceae bacterium]
MYKLSLNDELVQRTRKSFASDTDMTAWLQRQVEFLLMEYNKTQLAINRKAQEAIDVMRNISEQRGNSEMTLEEINREIQQARQARRTAV